jgi:pilus assembly protein CpaB
MKGRALVVVLALIMATVATAGVFLYARGVREEAKTSGETVSVVVSKIDIPPSTDLNVPIKDGDFKVVQVPKTVLVNGAVTSIDQLRDQNNSQEILANEQIPLARISGGVSGVLSIPDGMEALTVSLDASRGVAGVIQPGDEVVIYTTFRDIPHASTGKKAETTSTQTVVLVPEARILATYTPVSGSSFGSSETEQAAQALPGSLAVTVALTPADAQRFVFAMENGSMWFGLLPPKASGTPSSPISYAQVVK